MAIFNGYVSLPEGISMGISIDNGVYTPPNITGGHQSSSVLNPAKPY